MSRDEAEKIAVEMFKREHERWVQNAFVVFGAIAAIFVIRHDLTNSISVSIAFVAAAIAAFSAIFPMLSVRATTDAWRRTIRLIERSNESSDLRPFDIFQKRVGCFRYGEDLARAAGLWRLFPAMKRRILARRFSTDWTKRAESNCVWRLRNVLFSVTRFYLLCDVLLIIVLLCAAWRFRDKNPNQKPANLPAISKSLTWLDQTPLWPEMHP
jgi:hypothetical protein